MSGLLLLRAEHSSPDVSVGPGEIPPEVIDQAATAHEHWNRFLHGEMGGLGAVFAHDPLEDYPAVVETSPEPMLEPGQLSAMQAGIDLVDTSTPQPTPTPELVTPNPKWTFLDTLKHEVDKGRQRLAELGGSSHGRE